MADRNLNTVTCPNWGGHGETATRHPALTEVCGRCAGTGQLPAPARRAA